MCMCMYVCVYVYERVYIKADNTTHKPNKEKQRIISLYLQCNTQDEIANKSGVSQGRVAQIISKFKTEEINNLPVPDCLQYLKTYPMLVTGVCVCMYVCMCMSVCELKKKKERKNNNTHTHIHTHTHTHGLNSKNTILYYPEAS